MRAKKQRPQRGGVLPSDPSIRDFAAQLGMSKTDIHRWMDLAKIPPYDFERLLSESRDKMSKTGRIFSARTILAAWKPSPRGDRLNQLIVTCPHCGGVLR
mgnify:CR=1 FL=1